MSKLFVKPGLFLATFGAVALVAVPTLAMSSNARANAQTTPVTVDSQTTPATNGTTAKDQAKTQAQTRLADAKLKVCQNREKVVTNIMARIADRGQKQLDLFTTIATRTETFYTTKGKTLSNYDALVADVNAQHTSAQTAVDTIKATSVTFKCDGTDPKGMVSSFKDSLKLEISALQDYRTAVKNLIVGVKSVQSTTTSTTSTTTTTTNKTTGGN